MSAKSSVKLWRNFLFVAPQQQKRRKRTHPSTMRIILLTVMCSGLEKLINVREVFSSKLPDDEGQRDRNLRVVSIIYNFLQGEISTCWDPSL